jgi:hypothetical protein
VGHLKRRKCRLRNYKNSEEGPRRDKTTNNSRTKIGGNYSRTRGRIIKDAILTSRTID